MANRKLVRFVDDALAKCRAEGVCRNCGKRSMEMAHLIPRARDVALHKTNLSLHEQEKVLRAVADKRSLSLVEADETLKILYVHPDSVIPLCAPNGCHGQYDAGRLDVLPILDPRGGTAEGEMAVRLAGGIERARNRLKGEKP